MTPEQSTENYIDHEVRIRIQERLSDKMNLKLDFILGLIIASIGLPVLLHALKWI